MKGVRRLLAAVPAMGCGPLQVPPGAVDLGANPAAFGRNFDAEVGIQRLVLLLSPS
jgi:hypothetical protein